MKKRLDVYSMTQIALCTTILCISSYLIIPLPFTPVVLSMQTVMVNVIGLTQKPKHAAWCVLIYLMMGLVGLPVFSGGTSGAGKLFGPTGGFYFGFLAAVVVISLLKGRKIHVGRYALVTIAAGIPIQHFFAILFMCFHNGYQIKAAAVSVSLPFLPGDIVKCVMASFLAAALNKALAVISAPSVD